MKTTATIFLITLSTAVTLFSHLETLVTPVDKRMAKTSTGRPVPIANTAGKVAPAVDLIAKGIKMPKNRIAVYGQNARAKITPNR